MKGVHQVYTFLPRSLISITNTSLSNTPVLTTVETKKALLCWPVDSNNNSLIGSYGRSASVLKDRRQTARSNLVVSAPSTPVPVRFD
jgi:hypothetical protein